MILNTIYSNMLSYASVYVYLHMCMNMHGHTSSICLFMLQPPAPTTPPGEGVVGAGGWSCQPPADPQ